MEESISASVDDEPSSYVKASRRSDWKKWEQAILEEKEFLQQYCIWEFVDLPQGRKTIGCKWVFKMKRATIGESPKYKARLVANGYNQQPDVDYHETFTPMARNRKEGWIQLSQTKYIEGFYIYIEWRMQNLFLLPWNMATGEKKRWMKLVQKSL
ncbi:hypothetical protein Mapa_005810 [Marchantia paleacea]|nr:hypothetical protein Mapa_005810 [Marchantia paleacea]